MHAAILWTLLVASSAHAVAAGEQHPRSIQADVVLDDALRAKIATVVQQNGVPGYSLAVLRVGAPTEEEFGAWGLRTEAGDKLDKDSVMGLGSGSKSFTATALGLLMQDFANGHNVTALPHGLSSFTWQTALKDLLPDVWKLQDQWASEKANVHDIMSHVSGLPRHDLAYFRDEPAVDVIKRMRFLRPSAELRSVWQYNNIQYGVAQAIIERYSKKTLSDFVTARIFGPLNMTSSFYSFASANATGRASEYWSYFGRRIPHWLNDTDLGLIAGAGGVITTASDMVRWARLNIGSINGTDVGISPTVLQTCQSAQALVQTGLTYGYGWEQQDFQGVPTLWHEGSVPGVTTLTTLVPSKQMAVIQLANADQKDKAHTLVLNEVLSAMLSIATPTKRDIPSHDASPVVKRAAPAADLSVYAGTYVNPSYGTLVVCSSAHPSLACKPVLADFASLRKNASATPPSEMYGYFPRQKIWATQIRFGAVANATFAFTGTTIFPTGYGANTTAFEMVGSMPGATAEFMLAKHGKVAGLGLFALEGQPFAFEMVDGTVKDRAEVWFDKTA